MIHIEYRSRLLEIDYTQKVTFLYQAKTKLLLEGYLPSEDPHIWLKPFSDETAKLTPYYFGDDHD